MRIATLVRASDAANAALNDPLRRLGWVVAATIALGWAGAPVFAQGCAPADDLTAVHHARERIDAYGPLVWPGWSAAPPVLLRSGDVDCLIRHPSPPEGFVAEGDGVARLRGHVLPVPAATAFEVGGVWSVAVPIRSELQAFVDEHVGPGVLVLDDALYTRTLLHEAFHAHQMTAIGGPPNVPEFGAPGATLDELASMSGFDAAQVDQGAALHAALSARTAGEAVAAVGRFLDRRDAWRERAPEGVAALERQLEWLEGTTRYADVLLALYPAPEPLRSGEEDAWAAFLDQVGDLASVPTDARDRYAALGAAQAFLLDRLDPGWKARAIPGGASLESLLRRIVAGAGGVPVGLRDMPLETVTIDGQLWRLAVADEPQAWAQGLQGVTHLGSVDGVWFVFPEDVDAPFWMRGARRPLDIAFFDAEGRGLATLTMPTCDAEPCPTYRPDVPYRSAVETSAGRLTGRGDLLGLRTD